MFNELLNTYTVFTYLETVTYCLSIKKAHTNSTHSTYILIF